MNKLLISLLFISSLIFASCKGEEKTTEIVIDTNTNAQTGTVDLGDINVRYQLSTHILDISKGRPAEGVLISLYKTTDKADEWELIATNTTDINGRIRNFLPLEEGDTNNIGTYKLKFETKPYFQAQNLNSIYPFIEVVFDINEPTHYHIPITTSANGYSTYRGN